MKIFRRVLAPGALLVFIFAFLPSAEAASGAPSVLALKGESRPSSRHVDPAQIERLRRIMTPLLKAMNHPRSPDHVQVGIISDPEINAANAGDGKFYVTSGLLEKPTMSN